MINKIVWCGRIVFTVAVIWSVHGRGAGALSSVEALPFATYVASGGARPEKGELKPGKSGDVAFPLWSDLGKASIKIVFAQPVRLPCLAVLRSGWGDWAVPEIIGVKVNDGQERTVTLTSARIQPNEKKAVLPVDILELSETPVRSLELRVLKIETKANRHGTIKLAVPRSTPVSVLLPPTVGVSDGIGLSLNASMPVSGLSVKVSAYRFRSVISWECALPDLVAGKHELKLNWNDFISAQSPNVKLTPWNLYRLEIVAPAGSSGVELSGWKLLTNGQNNGNPPWDRVPELSFAADADGWRNGIPSDGFGRFGFVPGNGILLGNITGDSYNYEVISANKGAISLHLRLNCGIAPKTVWHRQTVDWTGVTMMQLKRLDVGQEPISKAFGVYDQSRLPETWIYSILVPGFLINSMEKVFSVTAAKTDGRVWALCPLKTGPAWYPVDKELPLDKLSEGWLLLAWDKKPELPVLLALQKKPVKLVADGNGVGLVFPEEMGYVGIGTPAGFRGWDGTPGKNDPATAALAVKSRNLAAILRAYPRTCTMRFKDIGDDISFRESFGYVCWANQWQEKERRVVPVSPLLAFAAKQGYPVKWPQGAPKDQGIDTKYGPFCAWEGVMAAEYSLPVPPDDVTLYLKPKNNATADQVATAINGYFKPWVEAEKIDSLAAWWMFASASLALPLLNPEQHAHMAAMWRPRQEAVFSARAWHLRIEPYSGIPYLISFAWMDKANRILGDPNSGIGAALYGTWAYARTTGDWKLMTDNWSKINKMLRFFLVSHDWVQMQTGCREHTASSAIDMDGIAYEGVVAYYHLARELDKHDETAMSKMLLSRLGLSTVARWWGMHWRNPAAARSQWTAIGIGFNENHGFDNMNSRNGGPDHVNGEMALALSWVGQYPELYALHLWGNGREFWRFFEYEYMEKKVENWRKKHPGKRNWHDANIAAHLYMRALLDNDIRQIAAEMERQKDNKGISIFAKPDSRMACEDAGFYALYLGFDFPVRIRDWGKAVLQRAVFDSETRSAIIELTARVPGSLALELVKSPKSAVLNGQPLKIAAGKAFIQFPAGKSSLQLKF